jgi:hypothetical protein
MDLIERIGGYLRNRLLHMPKMIIKMTEDLHTMCSLWFGKVM